MAIIALRTIIVYIVVLFSIRLMGKSELSKLSPFQLVITFMIAELAAIPIESPSVPILTGITAIFSLVFLQVLISSISIKSERFKNFINGRPSMLIKNGDINVDELRSLRMTINDLIEQLRLANVPSVTDVGYAIMESNGSLSVKLKPKNNHLKQNDFNYNPSSSAMPCVVFSDGTIYKHNLKETGFSESHLTNILKECKITPFMIFCDENKNLHIYEEILPGLVRDVSDKITRSHHQNTINR